MIFELIALAVVGLVAGFVCSFWLGLRRTHWYDRSTRTWRLKESA